jgi:hypothetical protein
MSARDHLWSRVYADTLQRRSHIEAEEVANFAVRAFDRRAALATKPPAGEQKPVMTYLGRHTMDCGEHGSHDMEMHVLIPAGTKLYTAPQPEQVAQALGTIADVAHSSGLAGLSESDALILIRHLTISYWDMTKAPEQAAKDIRAARTRGEQGGAV